MPSGSKQEMPEVTRSRSIAAWVLCAGAPRAQAASGPPRSWIDPDKGVIQNAENWKFENLRIRIVDRSTVDLKESRDVTGLPEEGANT